MPDQNPSGTRRRIPRDVQIIRYISLIAGTVGAMYGEYTLARQTGMDARFAWSYFVCLDLYTLAAFRMGKGRDIGVALGLLAASQAVSHLISSHVIRMNTLIILLVWAVFLPLSLWRVHSMGHGGEVPDQPQEVPASIPTLAQIVAAVPVPTLDEIVEAVTQTQAMPPAGEAQPEPGKKNRYTQEELDKAVALLRDSGLDTPVIAAAVGRTPRHVNTARRRIDQKQRSAELVLAGT